LGFIAIWQGHQINLGMTDIADTQSEDQEGRGNKVTHG
jgi:hypothetical protein